MGQNRFTAGTWGSRCLSALALIAAPLRRRVPVLILICSLCAVVGVFVGSEVIRAGSLKADDLLSENAIRDAILGRTELSADERELLDLNEDGKFDSADLVFYLKATSSGTPVASFENISSIVKEGANTASIRVNFTQKFIGTLHYTIVDGTATQGTDYTTPSGTVVVTDSFVDIPIALLDDAEIEEADTLVLRLELDNGYAIEEPLEHTVFINDNDGLWVGSFEKDMMRMGFDMTIIHSGQGYQGYLSSDGHGFLPAGEWEADFAVTSDTFQATVVGIPVTDSPTELGVSFTRSFVFLAEPAAAPYVFDLDSVIIGVATEALTPNDGELLYMERTGTGRFSLSRGVTEVTPIEPVLEPVP